MKKNLILIVLFLIAGIYSCKKDTVDYPITYSSSSISDPSIKVYTRNGEVTSSDLINKLVVRFQDKLKISENDKIKGKVIVNYISADSVELTIDNVKEAKSRSVHEINGVIYLEKQDTTLKGFGPTFKIDDVYKYSPIYYEEYYAPAGSGYSKYAKIKDCYFLINKGGTLNIPMFNFLWVWNTNSAYPYSGNNNSFKPEGLQKFNYADTIIIQQYYIEMQIN